MTIQMVKLSRREAEREGGREERRERRERREGERKKKKNQNRIEQEKITCSSIQRGALSLLPAGPRCAR